MQSLSVISVNLWQIIISLLNLLILFLIIKKFLYGPVKKMLKARQDEIDNKYSLANQAIENAENDHAYWQEKRESADTEADAIIQDATLTAKLRGEKIVEEAKEKADGIIRRAETEAELEKEKAAASIKKEIVEVSTALAQKIISREINAEDHRDLIDSVIEDIGDNK